MPQPFPAIRRYSGQSMESFRRAAAFLRFGLVLYLLLCHGGGVAGAQSSSGATTKSRELHRIVEGRRRVERMGEDACSKDDILVYQGATAPLPNGIPTYTVQILNTCAAGCGVADIHMSCGWFSSARLINPRVFRRLRYDDCLVNDGAALAPGESLSFQYANTYPYPLAIASASCC